MSFTDLLLSPRADDLFVSVAAVPEARELQEIDVPEAQREAHVAIDAAIFHASQRLPNPGARIALIKGDPGSGKTHVLTTALERAATRSGDVYPVVLQLSAPVARADYERWLLEALFRELTARYFGRTRRAGEPQDGGESPLRRATRRLLERAPQEQVDALARALDDGEDAAVSHALAVGRAIRRAARDVTTEEPPSEAFFAVVLLAGLGDGSAIRWLRRGDPDERLAPLGLTHPQTPHDRMMVVRDLGLLLQAVGGVLAIGFDQVENTVRLGSEELFVHATAQAVRLAESVLSVAVVLAVLGAEYERIAGGNSASPGLPESDRYRIEKERPAETYIRTPSARILERVVGQRLAVLRAREKLEPAEQPLDPLPAWFVARLGEVRTVRFALREVNRLRERGAELGRLPTEGELDAPLDEPTAPLAPPDFDKAWADHRDREGLVVEPVDLATKAERLAWWVHAASEERTSGDAVLATVREPTRDLDLYVLELELTGSEGAHTRREIGLCEATGRGGKLTKQMDSFLAFCTGTPVAVRSGPFPRGRNGQPGDALRALYARQGVAIELTELDWHLLGQARAFAEARGADPEFVRWRRDAQWSVQLLPDPGPILPVIEAVGTPAAAPGFPVPLGRSLDRDEGISWDPLRPAPEQLSNYGFLVTGDAGTGKTHTLRLLIRAACRHGLPVCVLDFRGELCDAAFTDANGLEVIDLARRGLPFDPLAPPPGRADSAGAQAVSHAYDVAGILTRVFAFGPVLETQLRNAMVAVYRQAGIDPQQWLDPAAVKWPSFADLLAVLRGDPKAAPLAASLDAFEQLGLLPRGDAPALDEVLRRRVILRATGLPTEEIKRIVAELLCLQLHGHVVRAPSEGRSSELSRLFVFDEAHRIRHSRRLEGLVRDGRPFGVGVLLATALPSDLPENVAANLATCLYLMNGQAEQRASVVRQVFGSTASPPARELLDRLGRLRPYEGLLVSQHHRPFELIRLDGSQ